MTTTIPFSLRRPLRYMLLTSVSLSACGGEDENGKRATRAPGASTPDALQGPSPAPGNQDANPSEDTPIRITFGDAVIAARLHDNATARDLAAQLPLKLTFRDHNGVEKTTPLPRELSLEGEECVGLRQTVDTRLERSQRKVPKVLSRIERIVGDDDLGALPAVGVRDLDGGQFSEEVGEHEQLGAAVAPRERVGLVVIGEEHAEVAVCDDGLGMAQVDQAPVVLKHLVGVG